MRLFFRLTINFSLIITIFLFTSFGSGRVPINFPTSAIFEKEIRNKFDHMAVFRWSQYTKLLEKLQDSKFIVLPLNEMRNTIDSTKVIVGLRHDVDLNPYKAVEMARIEKLFDIRSTYYFLATAEYFGQIENSRLVRFPGIREIVLEVHRTGAEIGIHNDLLTVMMIHKADPYNFNKEELKYYKSLGISVHGSASHGSPLARNIKILNYQIFSEYAPVDDVLYEGEKYRLGKHSLKNYGFSYEAYKIPFNKYYSESGGKWNDPEGFEGILSQLDSSEQGDRIQILVHPDWWGKSEAGSAL
jgi:hypothetical protein